MKTTLFSLLFAAASLAMAGSSYAQFRYSSCANSNTQACKEAREAFAEHHGGVYPEKYFDNYYQGRPGRWTKEKDEWRWDGMDGDRYYKGPHGWEWRKYKH
jgi:hypothetical protein